MIFSVCASVHVSITHIFKMCSLPSKTARPTLSDARQSCLVAAQTAPYFWPAIACCLEISVNVYMYVCVGWRGYDVKGLQ